MIDKSYFDICCEKGNDAMTKYFLDKSIDLENVGSSGLFKASRHGHKKIVKMLLDHGIYANYEDIKYAIRAKCFETFELLFQNLKEPDLEYIKKQAEMYHNESVLNYLYANV